MYKYETADLVNNTLFYEPSVHKHGNNHKMPHEIFMQSYEGAAHLFQMTPLIRTVFLTHTPLKVC